MYDSILGWPNYFTTPYFWVTTGATLIVVFLWAWNSYKWEVLDEMRAEGMID